MLESRFFVPMGVLAEGVTFGVVHCGDIGHVLIIEFKSGQVEVLTLALRVQGLRDGHVAVLEVPAQNGLDHGNTVLGGDTLQVRVTQHLVGAAQRAPCLGDDAVRVVVGQLFALLEVRVQLNLVDGRGHARIANEQINMAGQEVADADMLDQPTFTGFDQRLPYLNELAEATDGLSKADMEKLGAVVMLAKPKSAAQIKNLAENLDLFDFAPGAHTPAEYGKYMIQQSGRFEYDENLDEFYDYEGYALQRMNEEDGMFTDRGYIAYKGYISLAEIMDGSQSSRMEMGGMV